MEREYSKATVLKRIFRCMKPYRARIALVVFLMLVQSTIITLLPANDRYRPIEILPGDEFSVWGVVTYTIRKF